MLVHNLKRTINNNFEAKWFTTLLGWHTILPDDSSTTFCRVKSILLFMRSTVEYKKLFNIRDYFLLRWDGTKCSEILNFAFELNISRTWNKLLKNGSSNNKIMMSRYKKIDKLVNLDLSHQKSALNRSLVMLQIIFLCQQ